MGLICWGRIISISPKHVVPPLSCKQTLPGALFSFLLIPHPCSFEAKCLEELSSLAAASAPGLSPPPPSPHRPCCPPEKPRSWVTHGQTHRHPHLLCLATPSLSLASRIPLSPNFPSSPQLLFSRVLCCLLLWRWCAPGPHPRIPSFLWLPVDHCAQGQG